MKVLNENVVNYFELMIEDFSCGNDNEFKVGSRVSFLFEEIEKADLDNYEEEDVNEFLSVRDFIKNEGGKVKYVGTFNDEPLEYIFELVNNGKDIKCSWIEPKW
jgi:hypothetical protein